VRDLNRSRVTAACSVLTARYHVRRCRAKGRDRCPFLLYRIMADASNQSARDWLSNTRTNLLAWWLPQAAILAALAAPPFIRATIWIAALIWMGTACILNARQCGRTHCRYTGPYYLAMIVPVLILISGIVTANFYGWLALGVLILAGSKIIWWATERAWGRFS
jgi:hypothetical protein